MGFDHGCGGRAARGRGRRARLHLRARGVRHADRGEAARGGGGPRSDGHGRSVGGHGPVHPQRGPPGCGVDGHRRRGHGDVGSEGEAPPATAGPPGGDVARPGPRVRERRLHFLQRRTARGATPRVGPRPAHPQGQDQDRPGLGEPGGTGPGPGDPGPQDGRRRSRAVRGCQRRLHAKAGRSGGPRSIVGGRDLVRGAGVVGRPGRPARDPRPDRHRRGGRGVRIRPVLLRADAVRRGRRLPSGGRVEVRGHHRVV